MSEDITVFMEARKQKHNEHIQRYLKIKSLTDKEISLLVAEVEGIDAQSAASYDPMGDNWIAFDLIVKYDVTRNYEEYNLIGFGYHCHGSDNPIIITEISDDYNLSEFQITPNRAICMAILQAKYQLIDGELKRREGDNGLNCSNDDKIS